MFIVSSSLLIGSGRHLEGDCSGFFCPSSCWELTYIQDLKVIGLLVWSVCFICRGGGSPWWNWNRRSLGPFTWPGNVKKGTRECSWTSSASLDLFSELRSVRSGYFQSLLRWRWHSRRMRRNWQWVFNHFGPGHVEKMRRVQGMS